ncbi:MAG TPA: thioredoxin [Victivallales bacterium]|nr:thioredoxin [Victivallales bacterium]HRR06172.1 thioredoxin [Victivallales bacterium]HRR28488.1 thioredoxin [Victivallales bacterium]
MSKVKHLDSSNFNDEVKDKVVLVDFWAEWCGPCRMMLPVLEQVADEIGDRAVIAKVNVDEAQELAVKYGVRSIPALFLLKNSEVVWQAVGVQSKKVLIDAIENALN